MRSTSYLPQLLTVAVISTAAVAKTPYLFPLDKQFVAVSLNGQNYPANSPTFTVKPGPNDEGLRGAGFAGCNTWTGRVALGEGLITLGELGTTRMFCADKMAAESGFLDALKSVNRWRMDGPNLVLESEQTTLLLVPAAAIKP